MTRSRFPVMLLTALALLLQWGLMPAHCLAMASAMANADNPYICLANGHSDHSDHGVPHDPDCPSCHVVAAVLPTPPAGVAAVVVAWTRMDFSAADRVVASGLRAACQHQPRAPPVLI